MYIALHYVTPHYTAIFYRLTGFFVGLTTAFASAATSSLYYWLVILCSIAFLYLQPLSSISSNSLWLVFNLCTTRLNIDILTDWILSLVTLQNMLCWMIHCSELKTVSCCMKTPHWIRWLSKQCSWMLRLSHQWTIF